MKHVLVGPTMVAAIIAFGAASAAETTQASEAAKQLVDLVKPHEREAQAIRFMLAVAPVGMPEGLADCTVEEAMPSMQAYFATLFATHLSDQELQQAVAFFHGATGQAAVALRQQHEQSLLNAAAKGEQVADAELHYPDGIRKALAAFGATPAGRFFVGEELVARDPFRSEVSDLRSAAMAKCLTEAAPGNQGTRQDIP